MTLHPSLILLLGAMVSLLPLGKLRHVLVLLAPLGAAWSLTRLADIEVASPLPGLDSLHFVTVSDWNMPFAVIFCLMLFLGALFGRPLDNRMEDCAGLLYAASALGTVLAGDLFTFYCFWEMLAVFATLVVFAGGRRGSKSAAFRYFVFHLAGGLILLFGLLMRLSAGYDVKVGPIGLDAPGSWMIFVGLGINCAWPFLHSWLIDAYPESSPSGVLYLSSFTTKSAVYALCVMFAGVKALIVIGAAMAIFPIFYAVIENDLRKVLAYSMINQIGFMVVGVGIGTDLALNGAVCHAMTDVVFKGLLYMTVGACLYRTGFSTATDLGGLFRQMPVSATCCIIAAASISAVPGFSGFVSKSMIVSAASDPGHPYTILWLVLLFASAGVMEHAGIKIPYFAFFGHDSGHKVKEVPFTMQAAMVGASLVCLGFGLFPQATVYRLLPLAHSYQPYTAEHIVTQLQLVLFAALSVAFLLLAGVYPAEIRARNLDFDWVLGKVSRMIGRLMDSGLNGLNAFGDVIFLQMLPERVSHFFAHAPARVSTYFKSMSLRSQGVSDEEIERLEAHNYEKYKKSALAVGTSAIFAIIILGILAIL